ncbi:DUF3833 domain-containing protein [Algicola sagamiensis]|uniref:DUF3833 domain-containing protein n=1 Tax=Algicola sagamiensis TaxID=163869 RepID=UPI000378F287|nr:DUF3833 domain-containing protein [Algicola sagamiensis]
MRGCILICIILLAGCSTSIEDYRGNQPDFRLFEYFEGKTLAWGMVQDYSKKQTRRFEVLIEGTIENNELILNERFVFSDGEKQTRIWKIKDVGDGYYTGRANDILGTAQGKVVGNALHWQYAMVLTVDGKDYEVDFDDWMYRQDSKHLFNLTAIKKFGVEVGKVTIFFQKQ